MYKINKYLLALLSITILFSINFHLFAEIILSDGTKVRYHWTKNPNYPDLFGKTFTGDAYNGFMKSSRTTANGNQNGEGLYTADDVFSSKEFGIWPIEVREKAGTDQLNQYGHARAESGAVWRFTNTPSENISFHPLTLQGLDEKDKRECFFAGVDASKREGSIHRLQQDVEKALYHLNGDEWKRSASNNQHPIQLVQMKGRKINEYSSNEKIEVAGTLLIKNLSFQKDIKVFYTIDDWKTKNSVSVRYSSSLGNNEELWTFDISNIPQKADVKFYFQYHNPEKDEDFYDSNMNQNYTLNDVDGLSRPANAHCYYSHLYESYSCTNVNGQVHEDYYRQYESYKNNGWSQQYTREENRYYNW